MKRLQVMSSGGGTQSNAMIVLIAQGKLPKPDLIVMADTEFEASNVFRYQRDHIKPICDAMGVEYVIVKRSDYTDWGIVSPHNDEMVLPGFFTEYEGRQANGECGKQPGYCSAKWKSEVIQRYLNKRYGTAELNKRGVDFWIGMSLDEMNRVKITSGKWQRKYPLVELRLTRSQAIKVVQDYGLPEPPRSSCWMCPNKHVTEWQWMRDNVPQDFAAAISFERVLQKEFPHLWLTKKGIPLLEVDFDALVREYEEKPEHVDEDKYKQFCDSGMCFV